MAASVGTQTDDCNAVQKFRKPEVEVLTNSLEIGLVLSLECERKITPLCCSVESAVFTCGWIDDFKGSRVELNPIQYC